MQNIQTNKNSILSWRKSKKKKNFYYAIGSGDQYDDLCGRLVIDKKIINQGCK